MQLWQQWLLGFGNLIMWHPSKSPHFSLAHTTSLYWKQKERLHLVLVTNHRTSDSYLFDKGRREKNLKFFLQKITHFGLISKFHDFSMTRTPSLPIVGENVRIQHIFFSFWLEFDFLAHCRQISPFPVWEWTVGVTSLSIAGSWNQCRTSLPSMGIEFLDCWSDFPSRCGDSWIVKSV